MPTASPHAYMFLFNMYLTLKTTSMQILERAGVQLSQQDLQRLASRFDVHDDGFISTQLFIHFLDGSTTTTASATATASDNDKYSSGKASRNQSQHSTSRKHNSNEHNDSEGMYFNILKY
jgi:hypothetical protein